MIGVLRRRVMGNMPSLPYDAEVEYLIFADTQGIDTNIIGDLIYTFELEVNVSSLVNSSENKNKLFMSRQTSSSRYYEVEISNQSNYLRPRYNTDKNLTTYSVPLNTDLTILLNTDGQYIVNGEVVKTVTRVNLSTTKHLYIGNSGVSANCGFNGRYYYFKLYNGTSLLLDLIPVRVGTDGYFYDKVSKVLFKATNGTTFTVGPDKI